MILSGLKLFAIAAALVAALVGGGYFMVGGYYAVRSGRWIVLPGSMRDLCVTNTANLYVYRARAALKANPRAVVRYRAVGVLDFRRPAPVVIAIGPKMRKELAQFELSQIRKDLEHVCDIGGAHGTKGRGREGIGEFEAAP